MGTTYSFKTFGMKKFVVERNLPGAACLTTDELQVISRLSCEAIVSLGQPYHWISSFITEDKIYCIHIAENEDVIREHARLSKMPVNTISEVIEIIDPLTSNPIKCLPKIN